MKITKDVLIKIIKEETSAVMSESPVFGFDIDVGSKDMAAVILQMVRGYAIGSPPADVDMDPEALGMLASDIAKEIGVDDDGTEQITRVAGEIEREG